MPRASSRTSSDRPLEFFFDRSLGKISAHRLRDAGYTVHLIADFYPDDAQQIGDSEWIAVWSGSARTGRCTRPPGGVAFGQGHETTIAQVVADMLGVAYDDVQVQRGSDSSLSAQTGMSGSYASQFAVTGIGAILNATKKLVHEISLVAASTLGCAPTDIVLRDGHAVVADDRRRAVRGRTGGRLGSADTGRRPEAPAAAPGSLA